LDPNLKLTTGQVSKKNWAEAGILPGLPSSCPFEGGYIADTPGFSNINLAELLLLI